VAESVAQGPVKLAAFLAGYGLLLTAYAWGLWRWGHYLDRRIMPPTPRAPQGPDRHRLAERAIWARQGSAPPRESRS
jgi:hypothetical protein